MHKTIHFSLCIYNSTLNYTIYDDINLYLGWTSLHRAAQNGHTEIVKMLLDDGANVSTKDDEYSKKDNNSYIYI